MHPLRVYLDTSVIGGCFDQEFAEASQKLMELVRMGIYHALISQVTLDELIGAPKHVQAVIAQLGPDELTTLPILPEVELLTDQYLDAAIVTKKYREDAAHIANATIHHADVLVSWNFRHIVNLDKIRKFNAVNRANGFADLEIRSPRELIYGQKKKDI